VKGWRRAAGAAALAAAGATAFPGCASMDGREGVSWADVGITTLGVLAVFGAALCDDEFDDDCCCR